jgi:hypothetical protein
VCLVKIVEVPGSPLQPSIGELQRCLGSTRWYIDATPPMMPNRTSSWRAAASRQASRARSYRPTCSEAVSELASHAPRWAPARRSAARAEGIAQAHLQPGPTAFGLQPAEPVGRRGSPRRAGVREPGLPLGVRQVREPRRPARRHELVHPEFGGRQVGAVELRVESSAPPPAPRSPARHQAPVLQLDSPCSRGAGTEGTPRARRHCWCPPPPSGPAPPGRAPSGACARSRRRSLPAPGSRRRRPGRSSATRGVRHRRRG